MKYVLLLFLAALIGCASPSNAPTRSGVYWDLASSKKGSAVLVANGTEHRVVTNASNPHQELTRAEFADYQIPAEARIALYSWHAGFGEVLWVVQKGSQLEVYQREMDESETSHYPVKRLLVVPLN